MNTISPEKLKSRIDAGEEIQIIDIREYHEVESGNMGGLHIPMAEVLNRSAEIRKDCPVVIHCKSGSRASAMVFALQSEKGFDNVLNLEGGLEGWAKTIDPQITVY